MNQVILTGNLCRDPELRRTVNDSYVGSTAIAVSRDRKNEQGEYESDFFDIKFFGKQADFAAKHLRKGDKVCISGRIQVRDYVTRDGVKGRALEVLTEKVEKLSPKSDEDSPAPEAEETAPVEESKNLDSIEISDEDLPF